MTNYSMGAFLKQEGTSIVLHWICFLSVYTANNILVREPFIVSDIDLFQQLLGPFSHNKFILVHKCHSQRRICQYHLLLARSARDEIVTFASIRLVVKGRKGPLLLEFAFAFFAWCNHCNKPLNCCKCYNIILLLMFIDHRS